MNAKKALKLEQIENIKQKIKDLRAKRKPLADKAKKAEGDGPALTKKEAIELEALTVDLEDTKTRLKEKEREKDFGKPPTGVYRGMRLEVAKDGADIDSFRQLNQTIDHMMANGARGATIAIKPWAAKALVDSLAKEIQDHEALLDQIPKSERDAKKALMARIEGLKLDAEDIVG